MKNARSAIIMLLYAVLALTLASCAAPQMGDRPSPGPGAQAGPTDALQACLADIPKEASAGQRALAEQTCRRNAASRAAVVGQDTAAETSRAATGTAGDTLQACLARIPKDASAGQRMIAQESCQRDEAGRKSIQAAPGL